MGPGGGGVLVLPYLDGERAPVWDPAASGAMIGLTTSTTLAQIYRGVLDGVVLSTLDLADRLEPVRGGAPWTVAGGGVRDAAWVQATADALGRAAHGGRPPRCRRRRTRRVRRDRRAATAAGWAHRRARWRTLARGGTSSPPSTAACTRPSPIGCTDCGALADDGAAV